MPDFHFGVWEMITLLCLVPVLAGTLAIWGVVVVFKVVTRGKTHSGSKGGQGDEVELLKRRERLGGG